MSELTPIVGETQKAVCTVPASVIGAMSVCGSNGIEAMVSFCTTVADGMKQTVVPSGGLFFSASPAIVPEAPVLLSMMTLRPVRCFSASAMKRAITSLPPPAGKPIRILSGLSGSAVSARAMAGPTKAAAAILRPVRRVISIFMFAPPMG